MWTSISGRWVRIWEGKKKRGNQNHLFLYSHEQHTDGQLTFTMRLPLDLCHRRVKLILHLAVYEETYQHRQQLTSIALLFTKNVWRSKDMWSLRVHVAILFPLGRSSENMCMRVLFQSKKMDMKEKKTKQMPYYALTHAFVSVVFKWNISTAPRIVEKKTISFCFGI